MTFQDFWDLCRTIWTTTRQTIQKTVQYETKIPFIFVIFFGIGMFLDFTSNRNYGDNTPVNIFFLLAFIIGPIIYWLDAYQRNCLLDCKDFWGCG